MELQLPSFLHPRVVSQHHPLHVLQHLSYLSDTLLRCWSSRGITTTTGIVPPFSEQERIGLLLLHRCCFRSVEEEIPRSTTILTCHPFPLPLSPFLPWRLIYPPPPPSSPPLPPPHPYPHPHPPSYHRTYADQR